jgi:hypothetical protein
MEIREMQIPETYDPGKCTTAAKVPQGKGTTEKGNAREGTRKARPGKGTTLVVPDEEPFRGFSP